MVLMKERVVSLNGATLIYTGTRKNVDRIVSQLRRDGVQAEGYHAGMEEAERILNE